jgi:ribokinase
MSIVVFGSINMDLVVTAPRLPKPGETLTGHSFRTVPGGKGANQAVACARLGVTTEMVGRVGGDVFGEALLENLESNRVGIKYIAQDEHTASGVAMIAVDDAAENNIIVVPGANGKVGPLDLVQLEQALAGARVLLVQLEIPLEVVSAAVEMGHQKGVSVILDPAPARQLPSEIYPWVDVLTPNEIEAAALVGYPLDDRESVQQAAQTLLEWGCRRVVIKMGGQGAYAADATGGQFYPAIPVQAVDTVAAGDAFNGAMATALCEGKSFSQAIQWGLAGGALAVTKAGAQDAMPDRVALLELLSSPNH